MSGSVPSNPVRHLVFLAALMIAMYVCMFTAQVNQIVNSDDVTARVFNETGHDACIVSLYGKKPVGACELAG